MAVNDTVDRIMAAFDALRPIVRDVLTEALSHAQPVPKPPTVADFIKVGSHTTDGRSFNVYAIGSEIPKGPHIDKVELTQDEIAATVAKWNAEAKITVKNTLNTTGELPALAPTVTLRDSLK